MNWNHFILLLTGMYLGYYAINIIADLYLKKDTNESPDQDVLFFSEDSQPEIIVYDDEPGPVANVAPVAAQDLAPQEPQGSYPAPAMTSTGAVSLKELNRVAQAGLLQYTKAIPY
jgi:hypothetical protein